MRLLVPTDGSPHALVAARLAALLAGDDGALALLYVAQDRALAALAGLDAAAALVGGAKGDLAARRSMENEQAGAALLALTRESLPSRRDGMPRRVETLYDTGHAGERVLAHLVRPEHDAAVVGSRGHGLLVRALLGSVSDEVLRHAAKPVVIARRDVVRTILVPSDGSPSAVRAAATAGELARRLDARVVLLHAAEFPVETYRHERPEVETAFREQAARTLEGARSAVDLPADRISERFVFHDAPHAILAEVDRSGEDLVVMGRRGRSPVPRGPMGSVALRVAADAAASVMIEP